MVAGVVSMRMYDMITHALHGEDRCAVAIYIFFVMVGVYFARGWGINSTNTTLRSARLASSRNCQSVRFSQRCDDFIRLCL